MKITKKQKLDRQQVLGWLGLFVSVAITCFWAFWGSIENFHEGWYFESFLSNIGLMFLQYLSPMLIFLALTLLAIKWPRLGGGLHGIMAVFGLMFFQANSIAATLLIILPLVGLGALYWFGRPRPRKNAIVLAIVLPVLTLLISGIAPAVRVAQRVDDGNLDARRVSGNGVILIWAPAGPGWPRQGGNWLHARKACQHLSDDGFSLEPDPVDIWRLPTVEEVVRSMALHGQNSAGTWDEETGEATYQSKPDKESPLWNIYSQVIYWWTATEVDADKAYIIVYDGKVWPRNKQFGPAYLGYRCVKSDIP
jgi:hypothetical protein